MQTINGKVVAVVAGGRVEGKRNIIKKTKIYVRIPYWALGGFIVSVKGSL